MEIGVTTFVETTPDVKTGKVISHAERIREVVEEIVLADRVGLDVFGVGEHHRKDYACSAPACFIGGSRIPDETDSSYQCSDGFVIGRSGTGFKICDCGRHFKRPGGNYGGRIIYRIVPLFGQDLKDYDELFEEKLDLLLQIRESEIVNWSGNTACHP